MRVAVRVYFCTMSQCSLLSVQLDVGCNRGVAIYSFIKSYLVLMVIALTSFISH